MIFIKGGALFVLNLGTADQADVVVKRILGEWPHKADQKDRWSGWEIWRLRSFPYPPHPMSV